MPKGKGSDFWALFHRKSKLRIGFRCSLATCKARSAIQCPGVPQSSTRPIGAYRPCTWRGLPLKPGAILIRSWILKDMGSIALKQRKLLFGSLNAKTHRLLPRLYAVVASRLRLYTGMQRRKKQFRSVKESKAC